MSLVWSPRQRNFEHSAAQAAPHLATHSGSHAADMDAGRQPATYMQKEHLAGQSWAQVTYKTVSHVQESRLVQETTHT